MVKISVSLFIISRIYLQTKPNAHKCCVEGCYRWCWKIARREEKKLKKIIVYGVLHSFMYGTVRVGKNLLVYSRQGDRESACLDRGKELRGEDSFVNDN